MWVKFHSWFLVGIKRGTLSSNHTHHSLCSTQCRLQLWYTYTSLFPSFYTFTDFVNFISDAEHCPEVFWHWRWPEDHIHSSSSGVCSLQTGEDLSRLTRWGQCVTVHIHCATIPVMWYRMIAGWRSRKRYSSFVERQYLPLSRLDQRSVWGCLCKEPWQLIRSKMRLLHMSLSVRYECQYITVSWLYLGRHFHCVKETFQIASHSRQPLCWLWLL